MTGMGPTRSIAVGTPRVDATRKTDSSVSRSATRSPLRNILLPSDQ